MKHLRAKIKDGKHAPNTSEGKKKKILVKLYRYWSTNQLPIVPPQWYLG